MIKKIMDFQAATADRIAEIFREGRQRRVLLADEVGLGKTIMAKAVIDRVREIRKSFNDDMYRVVYVCSNLNIVNQNTRNLGIEEVMNASESRLSMQHLKLHEKEKKLKSVAADGEMPELLIPLTPGTSFNISESLGNIAERAVMYLIVREDIGDSPRLSEFFKSRKDVMAQSWGNQIKWFTERFENVGGNYVQSTISELHSQPGYMKIIKDLCEQIDADQVDESLVRKCVSSLRKEFALVSLRQFEPDLVIMDEFQRFRELLDIDAESDMGMLLRQFFGDDPEKEPLVLLLSATPYKPYTTLEELNETNCDEQYEDFMYLMNFLFKNHPENNFRKVWDDYSASLSQLDAENFTVLFAHKNEAENMIYKTMCRTERKNVNLIHQRVEELPVSEGDILSYAHMQKVLDDCRKFCEEHPERRIRFNSFKVPVDYVKSCPYLLSFMNSYELKKNIESVYDDGNGGLRALPSKKVQDTCLVSQNSLNNFRNVPANNAKLELLMNEAFANHAELLLWVPSSHPYYSTSASNVFEKNRNFSKILVFSAWEMVPKMIACMLSYKAEQLVMKQAFSEATYANVKGRPHIYKDNVLFTSNSFLANIYDPKAYYGQTIRAIRKDLQQKILTHIREHYPNVAIGNVRCGEKLVSQTAAMLDGAEVECPEKISPKIISLLANLAIGSPAACLMRLLHDRKLTQETAECFHSLFSRRQSAAIIQVIYNKRDQDIYYEQVLDYCVMGNLQAVLDEFAFMVGGDSNLLADSLQAAFVNMANPSIHTNLNFGHNYKKFIVRTHYALYFGQAKAEDKELKRSASVRQAFNSPFYPFVLATTSVGQEGLDFHWYCRKIVHWNLPSNPQDLEQREGRINRYECLAIRRNVAKFFGDGIFDWKEIFDHCKEELHRDYPGSNDMIPYWCLPPDWIKQHEDELEMIERIVPVYPMSIDTARYDDLIAVLSLYRLTMGQPRQEELLKLIGGRLSQEQIDELLFDFSPSSPKHLKRPELDLG